jgi:hypothetical protein
MHFKTIKETMSLSKFAEDLIHEAFDLSDTKGEDYRVGSKRVHENFINVGAAFELSPHLVLAIYLKKHLDAFRNYMKTEGESESEPIRERAKDIINYLLLAIPLVRGMHLNLEQYNEFRLTACTAMLEAMENMDPSVFDQDKLSERLDSLFKAVEVALREENSVDLSHAAGGVITTIALILYYEQE